MKQSAIVDWLAQAIGQASKSAKFCVSGQLTVRDPGLEVEGLGAVPLPLKRGMAKELVARCQLAPYGKGTKTLVDKKVRNTHELDPKQFHLSDAWQAAIAEAVRHAAAELGLPADQLEARLYKLLVYERGGFFLPHRDSEKHERMVASLIVALPNRFEDGALIVRHGTTKHKLPFAEAAAGEAACFAAFYADCEHEVQRVTGGVRLCLAYNLVLSQKHVKQAAAAKPAAPTDKLAQAIRTWVTTQPGKPLVFALEHHYTERGLALELLKGADRQLADQVVAAAAQVDCLVHLAQVSRHLMQFADDGSFERGYRSDYRTPRRAIEIGETYEDDLNGKDWTALDGQKQPWGEIDFEPSSIVAAVPLDKWKPTTEEYEGFTGNAGNTLDRWYHRSAIVVWQRAQHFQMVALSGSASSIPLFFSMVGQLAKTPKAQLAAARSDCVRFARAISAEWSRRRLGMFDSATAKAAPREAFLKALLTLNDQESIAQMLAQAAEKDQELPLRSFIVSACRAHGWTAFAAQLKLLLTARSANQHRQDILVRDVDWLEGYCGEAVEEPAKTELARELCALVVEQLCVQPPQAQPYYAMYPRPGTAISGEALLLLLKALLVSGSEAELARVLHHVQQAPAAFDLDKYQVPCLKALVPWSHKQFGAVPPALAAWLSAVRQQLTAATASKPAPPSDWARPAEVVCKCEYCAKLNAFLADPAHEVGRIPAREDLRRHVEISINRHQCDVKHTLERKGSPHSLLLTKTTGSYQRAVKRYEADCKLLSSLPAP